MITSCHVWDVLLHDPFLMLVCELTKLNIEHRHLGKLYTYTHKDSTSAGKFQIRLVSDETHIAKK